MTEEIEKIHPTVALKERIQDFIEDIHSLHSTLPVMMMLTGQLRKEMKKHYDEFMDEHATIIKATEHTTQYSLDPENIHRSKRLKHQYDNFRNANRLIPRHFIISLVSQYDSFLGKLIRFLFEVKPESLNATEKNIPFTELMKFPNMEAVKEYVLEKEVESVIRKNHADQFGWLKEKLNTPFNKDLACWPTFIELTERRNLFVHTDGLVSSQYLTVCKQHNVPITEEIKVGDQLEVPNEYYEAAYRCIFEIGVKMAHVIWRKLCPDKLDGSDNNIINITFDLIQNKEYELSIQLLNFFTGKDIKHFSDSNYRLMLLNLAQAYKWNDNEGKCKTTLQRVDWSACGDNFKLAVAVLNEKYDEAYSCMKRLKHDKDFHQAFYRDWPIFKDIRKQGEFCSIFEECYGEPFDAEQTTEDEIIAEPEGGTYAENAGDLCKEQGSEAHP
jgi:hypothetical protein